MGDFPPLGDSEAGAAVVSALFFALGLGCFLQYKLTKFKLYVIGGTLAAVMRGVSYALRAGTIASGSSNIGKSATTIFFQGAGFGIAIAVLLLIIAGWLRNTHPHFKPTFWVPLRVATLLLFPCIIVFGPILGLASALLIYDTATEDSIRNGLRIRKAAALGMLIVASLAFLVTALSSWWSLQATGWVFNLRKHASNTIVCILPAGLFMVWSAGFRVAGTFSHPEIVREERLFYTLQVLPEFLQLAMWCIPTLYVRVHLSNRFQEWWGETNPADSKPMFGFPEPVLGSSTQLSVSADPSSKADNAAQRQDVVAEAV